MWRRRRWKMRSRPRNRETEDILEQECGDREKDERAVAEAEAEVRSEAAEALLPKRNRATADARADDVRRSSGNTIRE